MMQSINEFVAIPIVNLLLSWLAGIFLLSLVYYGVMGAFPEETLELKE